jgi:hypothetical protein
MFFIDYICLLSSKKKKEYFCMQPYRCKITFSGTTMRKHYFIKLLLIYFINTIIVSGGAL